MNRKEERAKNIQREGWCVPCSVCPPPVSLSVHATVMPESLVCVVVKRRLGGWCLWDHVHMCVFLCFTVNIFPTLKFNYKADGSLWISFTVFPPLILLLWWVHCKILLPHPLLLEKLYSASLEPTIYCKFENNYGKMRSRCHRKGVQRKT